MRLRTQLAIAFFLLAVLPLLGVTLYTWLRSERAFRQAVAAEAGDLAGEMSTRVDVVASDLKARLQRMRGRADGGQESPYQKARREALAAAEGEQLRLLLRAILSGAERRQGAIPFARDADGKVYAPDPADEAVLEGLGQVPGKPVARRDAGEWVVAESSDAETGIVIAVARPVGPALQEMRRAAAANLALGLGLAALALLGILPLSRRMTRHVASLTDGAQRLAAGDLDVRVPVPHGREFRHLAETFNLLARDLRRNQERLLEQERLRKELEIGRRIQEELLPRQPLVGPFGEVGGVSIPAREVGGDFFNYFTLGEDELAILVGDVSGKGVGAALLMASLQATIRARLGAERDLARLVHELDREMGSEEPLAPYYTLFLAAAGGAQRAVCATSTPGTTRSSWCARTESPSSFPRRGARRASTRAAPTRSARSSCGTGTPSSCSPTGSSRPRTRPASPSACPVSRRCSRSIGPGTFPCSSRAWTTRCGATGAPFEAADDATMVAMRFSNGALARSRA